jgi:hypothetical protein
VEGKGGRPDPEALGDNTRGEPTRPGSHQQPKYRQPSLLRERPERRSRCPYFHISIFIKLSK